MTTFNDTIVLGKANGKGKDKAKGKAKGKGKAEGKARHKGQNKRHVYIFNDTIVLSTNCF